MVESTVGEGAERRLTVYYDGACPICTTEVRFYRAQAGGEEIDWINLQFASEEDLKGLEKDKALSRLHVRDEQGEILEGVPAFAGLMERLPRLAWLGRAMNAPPLSWIMRGLYAVFLRIRPLLQRLARLVGIKPETP
ncbi:thiol-disulfide oxidoreductase DCC family protein [Neomegalonema perideroedes]|uniref:thiol-disulfide oxidoreductase DCC family protein n=1 Tax=Neomegalonema perideroedes TaxID=217219 RepID=UPI0012FDC50F|nr:DUF393 domain-containing protein [Neomegalonema perideroedes]